jgi:hypothetical protein
MRGFLHPDDQANGDRRTGWRGLCRVARCEPLKNHPLNISYIASMLHTFHADHWSEVQSNFKTQH